MAQNHSISQCSEVSFLLFLGAFVLQILSVRQRDIWSWKILHCWHGLHGEFGDSLTNLLDFCVAASAVGEAGYMETFLIRN